eukprot:CAMPEP_0119499724 /NCGR_PEP_ID=MMETSP1344-20130328/22094_1 /TAXON_ID=236787 /ORGANISM="Florenciella parvula, Strain CCMP2471" /LENGTH=41 /DNA_ID= /DNA_START= /DNA_END= /DNA_ORIENTATION=
MVPQPDNNGIFENVDFVPTQATKGPNRIMAWSIDLQGHDSS